MYSYRPYVEALYHICNVRICSVTAVNSPDTRSFIRHILTSVSLFSVSFIVYFIFNPLAPELFFFFNFSTFCT